MSNIKQPQDHLEKAVKPKVETIEVTVGEGDDKRTIPARRTTIQGITVTIPDEALDDFELLDDLRAIDVERNISRFPALLRRLVGNDYKSVMDGLRDKTTGRVGVKSGSLFVKEVLEALNPNS
jgi:hypothetical protein